MKRRNWSKPGGLVALAILGISLGGCVIHDRRPYRGYADEGPTHYYAAGHDDRRGYWRPGHHR